MKRGSNAELPQNLAGAFVPVFVSSVDPEVATTIAIDHLTELGFEFIQIQDERLHELDPRKWTQFVAQGWPEYAAHFPTQDAVLETLQTGFLFVGPYSSYEGADA